MVLIYINASKNPQNALLTVIMSKKILIVEDDEQNLKLFSEILQCAGYHVFEARNGFEGIRLAKSKNPHLIITDILMPIIDGFEFVKILKEDHITKDIPLIALTSYGLKGGREKYRQIGFADYVPKPIDIKELVRIVEKHIQNLRF